MSGFIEIKDPRVHCIDKGTPFTRLPGMQFTSLYGCYSRTRHEVAPSWRVTAVTYKEDAVEPIPDKYVVNIPGEGVFCGSIKDDFVIDKDGCRLVFFGDLQWSRGL